MRLASGCARDHETLFNGSPCLLDYDVILSEAAIWKREKKLIPLKKNDGTRQAPNHNFRLLIARGRISSKGALHEITNPKKIFKYLVRGVAFEIAQPRSRN